MATARKILLPVDIAHIHPEFVTLLNEVLPLNGSEVHLLYVKEELPSMENSLRSLGGPDEFDQQVRSQAKTVLDSFESQLTQLGAKRGSPQRITAATLDKADHHVRLTLASGARPLASYPAGKDKFLVDTLLRNGIKPVYTKRAVVHHTLRYIAGGVVAVLLLIGAGVWFYTRGRPQDPDTPDAQPTAA